jgi:hypothetical protein
MKSSFYVTVSSSEPCEFYRNKLCDFKNYLPTPITGHYEVALCSINYIYSSIVIPRNTLLGITSTRSQLKAKYNISSVADLSKHFEEIKKEVGKGLAGVSWSPEFSRVVDTTPSGRYFIKSEKFYEGLSEMNIFSNLVEPERFGSEMSPLLRTAPYTPNRQGAPVHETFPNLQYKRVPGAYIDSIHIYIRNELGQLLPIESGRVTAVLHFRDAVRH